MPENDCPINGVNCVSIARVEALERALEAQKQHSSLAREKIYDRLGELERGMDAARLKERLKLFQNKTMEPKQRFRFWKGKVKDEKEDHA